MSAGSASNRRKRDAQIYLGIETGGTRTSALAVTESGKGVSRLQTDSANLRLISDRKLLRLLRMIRERVPRPTSIAIGMAGARTEADRNRIRTAVNKIWPGRPCHPTSDLEIALTAAPPSRAVSTRVLIISGTGSCCFGQTTEGRTAMMGGWGHLLGDKGSGYEIGLRALKAAVFYYDRDGAWTTLGQRILRALQLNHPNDLMNWVRDAKKAEVARLAIEVFEAARRRDKIARDILEGAMNSLAKDGVACAGKLVEKGAPVQFIFSGSVLLKQPAFARNIAKLIRKDWPGAKVTSLKRESVWGAVELARLLVHGKEIPNPIFETAPPSGDPEFARVDSLAASPTEQRHPRSMRLDSMPISRAVELMLDEDSRIPRAILKEKDKIVWVVRRITKAFKKGGRLFYVGAGTSGRLGILDASECPPTFRAPPDLVQGIIAGGREAVWSAVEGAEDDPEAGADAVRFRGGGKNDVVVGIAASGRTPFVWGALSEAKRRGATAVLLCFNPNLKIPSVHRPHKIICPEIGPEILTGSTRLKAGTATKLILNIFTTLAMVQCGKVIGNLMVDLNPVNRKLRARAIRILSELTGQDYSASKTALEHSGWVIQKAYRKMKKLK